MIGVWVLFGIAIALTALVTLIAVLGRRHKRTTGGYTLENWVDHVSKLAGACSLILVIISLSLNFVIQNAHEKSARDANLNAASQAKEQRGLLEKVIRALSDSSEQLKLNASASQRAAAILAEEREERLRRPEIQMIMSVLNPAGGEGATVANMRSLYSKGSMTVMVAEDQQDILIRADLLNVGKAALREGSVSFRAVSLDDGLDPTILIDQVLGLKMPVEALGENGDADNEPFTNFLALPIRSLDLASKDVVMPLNLRIRVPRTKSEDHRTFKLSASFVGVDAETRAGDFKFVVKFGEAANSKYLQGQQAFDAQIYDQALRLFEDAAAAGNGTAMARLGYMYSEGLGVRLDYDQARRWYEKAIDATADTTAMNNLGYLYETGHGLQQDYQQANAWYEKAEASGNVLAMNNLGRLYESGHGVKQDYQQALEWYAKSAVKGNGWAMYNIGNMYANGRGVGQDYREARRWYEKSSAAGNSEAMNGLGFMYDYAQGVAQDYQQARKWYEKAAAAGNSSAMNNLGFMYDHAEGVAQDYQQARKWYEKAAAAGNSSGMNNLGFMYDHAEGVAQDLRQARQWYEKAAAAGNDAGMNNLGSMYDEARGVPQDYQVARHWYEKASAAGNSDAMNNLGFMYQSGHGIPQDLKQAREWYEKAAAQGNAGAKTKLQQPPFAEK